MLSAGLRRKIFNGVVEYMRHTRPHPGRGLLGTLAWKIYPEEIPVEIAPSVRLWIRLDRGDEIEHLTGTYEKDDEAQIFLSYLKPGMTVIDIGANIGLYSLLAGKTVGSTGRVIAFEPVPEIFERLGRHISLNGLTNILPQRIAISDTNGTGTFFLGRTGSSGSLFRQETSRSIRVNTETLDSFLRRKEIRKVDAVKVDAEGAEMRIVRGMQRLLLSSEKPLLMFEILPPALQPAGSSAEEIFDDIVSYGYAAFLMTRGEIRPVTRPVPPTHHGSRLYADNYLFKPAVKTLQP